MSGVVLLRVDRVGGAGGHPRHAHPALDLKIVEAGLTAAGQTVGLVDGWRLPGGPADWVRRVLAAAPAIAVLKGASWCLDEAVECGRLLRLAGVFTIAVGQQAVHAQRVPPPDWQAAFDLTLAGEPEEVLLELLPRLLAGDRRVLPLPDRHFEVGDPDALPFPRFNDEELRDFAFPFPLPGAPRRRWAYVLTARGCPHRCRHCSAVVRKSVGDRLRKRRASLVADEMAAHLDAGAEAIAFEDDTLLVDRRHFLELCEELGRRGIRVPWIANARPDELDAERVAAAAGAGACLFKVGVETATPRLIELLGKSRHGADWRDRSQEAFVRLRRHGIASVGLFLIGLPTETEAEVETTLAWAKTLAPDYVQVQIFRGYPDIRWWQDLPEAGRDAGGAYHYGPVASTAAAIAPERLPVLQRRFYRRFYLRPVFVLRHVLGAWRHYLHPAQLTAGLGRLGYLGRRP